MALQVFGWGKWGAGLLNGLQGHKSIHLFSIKDAAMGCDHFVDPLLAESYCARLPLFRNYSPRPEEVCYFDRETGFPVGKSEEEDFRLHLINAGDHFATGAASAFLRLNSTKDQDLAIVLLPPQGSNEATVGRFLAILYGLRDFLGSAIILDSEAMPFLLAPQDRIEAYVKALVLLLAAFERSGCMFPLMLRTGCRSFSFAACPIREITASLSLEPLWAGCTVPVKNGAAPPARSYLAFSVSAKREFELSRVFIRNFPLHKILHLPFYPRYEWKEARMPAIYPALIKDGYTGILCADHFTPVILKYLKRYKRQYFSQSDGSQESLDFNDGQWMRAHGLKELWSPLSASVLDEALHYLKTTTQNIRKEIEKK